MPDTPAPQTLPTPAPKKRSLGSRILRLFGILVVLLIVGLVVLYLMRNTLVRIGVVRGGQYATSQTTALQRADLMLFGGSLDLSQLEINNPTDRGFKEPKFLTMKDCAVSVDTGSLFSNTIVVEKIHISGLELYIEQQGAKNNLAVLMDTMKQKSAAAGPPPSASAPAAKSSAPTSPGRSLKVTQIRVASTKVHLRGLFPADFDLGPIMLNEPTNPDGRPMKLADVMVNILLHLSQQIVTSPKLPPEFQSGLADVGKFVNTLKLPDVTKGFGDLGNQAGQAVQGVTSQAGNTINDLGKGLGGLIPGLGGGTTKSATQP